MKKVVVVAVTAILLTATAAHAVAKKVPNARVRGVVLFLGDSNLTFGAGAVEEATTFWTHWDNGYVPVIASRIGAGIRTQDCPGSPFVLGYQCATWNYWSIRIPRISEQVKPDAIVVELNIADAFEPGNVGTRGFGDYAKKIDWFMRLLPKKIPILWTNMPCGLVAAPGQAGCNSTNAALREAGRRWKRFHLVDWGTLAGVHPEWMLPDNIHYTPAGNTAWADLVVAGLDKRLKYPAR